MPFRGSEITKSRGYPCTQTWIAIVIAVIGISENVPLVIAEDAPAKELSSTFESQTLIADDERILAFGISPRIVDDRLFCLSTLKPEHRDFPGTVIIHEYKIEDGRCIDRQSQEVRLPMDNDRMIGNLEIRGDVAIISNSIGEYLQTDCGIAYVLRRNTDGVWKLVQTIGPDKGLSGDQFGHAVCLCDDFLFISAPGANGAAQNCDGAVYVYRYGDSQSTPFEFHQRLFQSESNPGARFGGSVVRLCNLLLITAARRNYDNFDRSGRSLVFEMRNGMWTPHCEIGQPEPRSWDGFGGAACHTKTAFIVSAPRADLPQAVNSGDLFEFPAIEFGHKGFRPNPIRLDRPQPAYSLGRTLAAYQECLAVCAEGHKEKQRPCGAIFLFEKREEQWRPTAKYVPSDTGHDRRISTSDLQISNQVIVTRVLDPRRSYKNVDQPGALLIFDYTKRPSIGLSIIGNENRRMMHAAQKARSMEGLDSK